MCGISNSNNKFSRMFATLLVVTVFLLNCSNTVDNTNDTVEVQVKNNYFETLPQVEIAGEEFGSISMGETSSTKSISTGTWDVRIYTMSNLLITAKILVEPINTSKVTLTITRKGEVMISK